MPTFAMPLAAIGGTASMLLPPYQSRPNATTAFRCAGLALPELLWTASEAVPVSYTHSYCITGVCVYPVLKQ
jgi:hypothetical protein